MDEKKRTTQLVREIIGGKPIKQVHTSNFPGLRERLQEMRAQAIELNQLRRLKVIQHILAELSVIEARERERNANDSKEPAPTAQQLDSILQTLRQNKSSQTIESQVIPHLIQYIKKSVIPPLLQQKDFFTAHEYQSIQQQLEAEARHRRIDNSKKETYTKIVKALEAAETKMELETQEHERALSQWELSVAEAIERLNTKNSKELEDFDTMTQGPLPAFTKTFSSNLQNLAATQDHLVKAKRFKDAGLVHERLTQLRSLELGIIEDKHLRKRDAERQTMIERHQQQLKCLIDKYEAEKLTMVQAHDKVMNSLKYTIANLESKLFFMYQSTKLERKGEDGVTEAVTDWTSSIPVAVRSEFDRRLAKRQPWITGSMRTTNDVVVTEGVEPYWKSGITTGGETEVVPRRSRSVTSSPIKKKSKRTGSVSKQKRRSRTIGPETKIVADERSSARSFQFTASSKGKRSETAKESKSTTSKRSRTTQATKQNVYESFEVGKTVRHSCDAGAPRSRKNNTKLSTQGRMGFTQEVDERRTAGSQTKKNIGISHLVKKQTEFEKFCETVPPTRKTNF